MTVEESERLEKKSKQKEKHKAAFGWDVFNADTLYKAHRKKEKAMTIDMESYERQKAELGEKFYDPRDLTYGAVAAPPSENVDKLVEELNEQCVSSPVCFICCCNVIVSGSNVVRFQLFYDSFVSLLSCAWYLICCRCADARSGRRSAEDVRSTKKTTWIISTIATTTSTRNLRVRMTIIHRRSEKIWSAVQRCKEKASEKTVLLERFCFLRLCFVFINECRRLYNNTECLSHESRSTFCVTASNSSCNFAATSGLNCRNVRIARVMHTKTNSQP